MKQYYAMAWLPEYGGRVCKPCRGLGLTLGEVLEVHDEVLGMKGGRPQGRVVLVVTE